MPRSRVGNFRQELTRYTPWDPELVFLLHYVMFGCIFDRFVATLNSVQMDQSGAINAKVCATKSHLNLSLQTRTWDHFATALNSVQNVPNWCNKCKSSCHEVVSELFATNAPDPHHWTLNSCFVAFRKVWVHLGSFCYCTKLGAKWAVLAQLMQKFMPRSCVGTFRYEHTRNTPWDPKLMFCSIS